MKQFVKVRTNVALFHFLLYIMDGGKGATIESGATKSGKGSDETGGFQELFRINQVLYRMPPTLSVVAKRTGLQNYFTKTSYSNYQETMFCTFSTGEYYIAPKTSYLFIELGYKDPNLSPTSTPPINAFLDALACIPQGDIMSLFYEPLFFASSGTELCRETEKGLLSAVESRYKYDQQYIDTYGQAQGMSKGSYSAIWDGAGATGDYRIPHFGTGGTVLPRVGEGAHQQFGQSIQNICNSRGITTGLRQFIIPMDKVLGLFRPYNDCLLPAGMMAGSRFELRFKPPTESMFFNGLMNNNYFLKGSPWNLGTNQNLANLVSAANNITVTNIYWQLDAFQLQDAVLKRLNQTAAGQDGLSLLFDTHDYTPYSTNAGQFEAQVTQSRSRVVRSICVVRDQANLNNPYVNSYASEPAVYRVNSRIAPGALFNFGGATKLTQGGSTLTTGYTNNVLPYYTAAQLGGGNGQNDFPYFSTVFAVPAGTAPNEKYELSGLCNVMVADQCHDNSQAGIGGAAAPALQQGLVQMAPAAATPTVKNINTIHQTIVAPHPADPFLGTNGSPLNGSPVVLSYQAQLGALFFPQQPYKTAVEYYFNALFIYGKSMAAKDTASSVTYSDFLGGYGWNLNGLQNGTQQTTFGVPTGKFNLDPTFWTTFQLLPTNTTPPTTSNVPYIYPYGLAIYGALFEKNQLLEMSGLPISNARLLRHKFQFGDSTSLSGQGRSVVVYTTFTRALKVFLGGLCVVRE